MFGAIVVLSCWVDVPGCGEKVSAIGEALERFSAMGSFFYEEVAIGALWRNAESNLLVMQRGWRGDRDSNPRSSSNNRLTA